MDAKEWLRSRIANSSNEVKNAWDSMPTLFDALAEKCEAYAAAQTVELQQQVEALTKERDKLQYKYEAASDLFVASESKVERLTCELAEHSKAGSQLADGVISYKQRAERAEAEVMRLKGAAQAAIVPLGALIHSGTCDSGQLTSSLSEAIRTAHDLLLAALSAAQGEESALPTIEEMSGSIDGELLNYEGCGMKRPQAQPSTEPKSKISSWGFSGYVRVAPPKGGAQGEGE